MPKRTALHITDIDYWLALSQHRRWTVPRLLLALEHGESPTFNAIDWAGIDKDRQWASEPAHHIIPYHDRRYPSLLKQIPDPPFVLFVRGDPSLLQQPQIAIVGSRTPTPGGCENAFTFAQALVRADFTITSGLARGIDGESHRGALAAGGKTIAVNATGLDRVYPRSHQKLADAIAEQGALVSEYSTQTAIRRHHFPERNRIITGLSLGTLVVEATTRSGSLISARLAGVQGREVFALPGSIHNPLARGCHNLIRQGAKLVETLEDILEELPRLSKTPRSNTHTPPSRPKGPLDRLLDCVDFEPTPLDKIITRSGLPSAKVSSMLTALELEGWILLASGGYTRTHSIVK